MLACLICFMAVVVPPGMMPISTNSPQNSDLTAYDPVLQQLGFKLVICGWPRSAAAPEENSTGHPDHAPSDTHQICVFAGHIAWQMPMVALLLPLSLQLDQDIWSLDQAIWPAAIIAYYLARAPPFSSL